MEANFTVPFVLKRGIDGEMQEFERRPYQKRIKELKERFLVLVWHRRSGKTQTASHKLISEAIQNRDGRYAYLAPTYKQAKRIVWKILKSTLPNWLDVKINESDLTINIKGILGANYPINSQIELLGADDPDSLRGIGLNGAIMDEYDKMPNSLWGEIIRPTLAESNGWAWFLGTPKGRQKLYSLLAQAKYLNDWHGEILTVEDTNAISRAEMESIKSDPSISEDEVAQEYYCSFLYHSGLIYKEFNSAIHCIQPFEIPTNWQKFRAMDYGETNPTAWGWYALDNDGNVYKFREYRIAGEMVSTHAEKVKELTGMEEIAYSVIDPTVNNRRGASGHKIQKEYQIAGITTKLGKNNVQAGINRVREYLKIDPNRIHPITKRKGSPRLFIFDTCEWTKWEFERYRYKENNEGLEQNKAEQPLKLDDHCFTGDTKILMANGYQKMIKNIKAGELVKTKNGIHPVFYSRATRVCDIVEARFSNGSVLKATPDHKMFTNRGYIRLDSLRYRDSVEALNTNKLLLCKRKLGLIINATILTANTILRLADTLKEERGCTKLFGKRQMGKSQRDTTFITLTEIQRTMTSLILKLKKQAIIYRNILKYSTKDRNLERKLKKTLIELDRLQKSGIGLKRVENGTGSTLRRTGSVESQLRKFANSVVKNMTLSSQVFQSIAIRIVKLKPLGKDTVYNLTVEKEHNYYANGILVKNCMDETRYALMSLPATSCNVYVKNDKLDTTTKVLGNRVDQLLSLEDKYLENLKKLYPDDFKII